MKCPKCGYTSFDYLRECKKCGEILDDSRKALNLKMGEPTLFVGLSDKSNDDRESEVDKTEDIFESAPAVTGLSSPEADFSSSSLRDPLPEPQMIPTPGELRTPDSSENISSGLGSLGSMGNTQPVESKGDLEGHSKIETELPETNAFEGLELGPSFNTDHNIADSLEGEEGKEDEFALFADDEKPEIENHLENNIPFEFSADDLESDIDLSLPSESSDKDADAIELELDMDDEESLDQILAGLETNEK